MCEGDSVMTFNLPTKLCQQVRLTSVSSHSTSFLQSVKIDKDCQGQNNFKFYMGVNVLCSDQYS